MSPAFDKLKLVGIAMYFFGQKLTWAALRYELNTLAQVYNLPPVGSATY